MAFIIPQFAMETREFDKSAVESLARSAASPKMLEVMLDVFPAQSLYFVVHRTILFGHTDYLAKGYFSMEDVQKGQQPANDVYTVLQRELSRHPSSHRQYLPGDHLALVRLTAKQLRNQEYPPVKMPDIGPISLPLQEWQNAYSLLFEELGRHTPVRPLAVTPLISVG